MKVGLGLCAIVFASGAWASTPQVDGRIEEEEWSEARTGSGLFDPARREPVRFQGTYFLKADSQYIYFAYRAIQDPATIRSLETRDEGNLYGDDHVTLSLDVTGSVSEVSSFTVNAQGANSFSVAGGRAGKREWRGSVQSAGRLTEAGYEIELAIPWEVMRLPTSGKRTVRFNVSRSMPALLKTYDALLVEPGKSELPGEWADVEVPKPVFHPRLDLLGYTYLGGAHGSEPIQNSGLDIRAKINPRTDGLVTINPDFRNLEGSVLSLGYSYYERINSESRPFFSEGSGYMYGAPFRSQRVGNFDVGTKVYTKPDAKSTFGLMHLTDVGELSALVGAYNRQIGQRSSFSAGFASLRDHSRSNDAFRGGWTLPVQKNGNLRLNVKTSLDKIQGQGSSYAVDYTTSGPTFGSTFSVGRVEKHFAPALDFNFETDYNGLSWYINRWLQPKSGSVTNYYYNMGVGGSWRPTGKIISRSVDLGTGLTIRNKLDLSVGASVSQFGDFHDNSVAVSLSYPVNDDRRSDSISLGAGRTADQRQRSLTYSHYRRPTKDLSYDLSLEHYELFETQNQVVGTLSYRIGKFGSLSGRAVHASGKTNAYVSYRYAGNYGNEYFVILGDPNARTFRSQLILKAVIPTSIRF